MNREQTGGAATGADSERAREVIADAGSLIDKPEKWVRGIAADRDGGECEADDPAARAFCLYAAMRRAGGTAANDAAAEETPGLRDVHDAIERRMWRENAVIRYKREAGKPSRLVVAWNDEPEVCAHEDVMEVLGDADTAILIRGRALTKDDPPQQPLLSTGDRRLDDALWTLCGTLSNGDEGNSELIDAGEQVLAAWHGWQTTMR